MSYFTEFEAPHIRCVKEGDVLQVRVVEGIFHNRRRLRKEEYVIKKVYPFMVVTELCSIPHTRRCFTYGDLIMMRKERQEPRIEALRKCVDTDNNFF